MDRLLKLLKPRQISNNTPQFRRQGAHWNLFELTPCIDIILKAHKINKTDENMNKSCLFFLQAAALPKGAKVEIEAIAMVGEIIDENL